MHEVLVTPISAAAGSLLIAQGRLCDLCGCMLACIGIYAAGVVTGAGAAPLMLGVEVCLTLLLLACARTAFEPIQWADIARFAATASSLAAKSALFIAAGMATATIVARLDVAAMATHHAVAQACSLSSCLAGETLAVLAQSRALPLSAFARVVCAASLTTALACAAFVYACAGADAPVALLAGADTGLLAASKAYHGLVVQQQRCADLVPIYGAVMLAAVMAAVSPLPASSATVWAFWAAMHAARLAHHVIVVDLGVA